MNNSNPGGNKEEQGIPDFVKKLMALPQAEGSKCTCRADQKQRAICPVCDKEEYEKASAESEKMKQPKLSEKKEGPVWVKASERLPDKKVHAKYNEHFRSLMFAYQVWHFNSATYCRTFDPGHEQLQNIYWLESPSITRDGEREDSKTPLTIIVNGYPANIEAEDDDTLSVVSEKALIATLSMSYRIIQLELEPGEVLFLSLNAGIGASTEREDDWRDTIHGMVACYEGLCYRLPEADRGHYLHLPSFLKAAEFIHGKDDEDSTPEREEGERKYMLSNIAKQSGISDEWLRVWEQVEIWYGDIKKRESGEQFLKRLQATYFIPSPHPPYP